jgi:hypothetical protein
LHEVQNLKPQKFSAWSSAEEAWLLEEELYACVEATTSMAFRTCIYTERSIKQCRYFL